VCVRQQTAAQPGRPDGVGVLEDELATVFVPVGCHRERKAEEQGEQSEHRPLDGANLVSLRGVDSRVQPAPEPIPELRNQQEGRRRDDGQGSRVSEDVREEIVHSR
jgi:hypothetical protein